MPVGETSAEGIGREQVWAGGAGMNQPCCCPDRGGQPYRELWSQACSSEESHRWTQPGLTHLPIWLAVGHEPPPEEHDLDLRAEHNRDEAHNWRSWANKTLLTCWTASPSLKRYLSSSSAQGFACPSPPLPASPYSILSSTKIHRDNACGIKTPLVYSQKVGADCLPSVGVAHH